MTDINKPERTEMPLLVTAAVIFDGEKVLITRRPETSRQPGLWEFPGGKMDPSESPEDALRREIREELDAEISVQEIMDVVYYCYEWGPVLILAYRCQLLTTTLRNVGVAESRWVHPEMLAGFPFLAADLPIIQRLNGWKTYPKPPTSVF